MIKAAAGTRWEQWGRSESGAGSEEGQDLAKSIAKAGQEQGKSRAGAYFAHISSHAIFHEQGRSRIRAGAEQDQDRRRVGAD